MRGISVRESERQRNTRKEQEGDKERQGQSESKGTKKKGKKLEHGGWPEESRSTETQNMHRHSDRATRLFSTPIYFLPSLHFPAYPIHCLPFLSSLLLLPFFPPPLSTISFLPILPSFFPPFTPSFALFLFFILLQRVVCSAPAKPRADAKHDAVAHDAEHDGQSGDYAQYDDGQPGLPPGKGDRT